MNNEKNISLKDCIQVLSLFFILSVISVLLFYTKFEQGVKDFWQSREEYADVFENEILEDLIDLDSVEIPKDVSIIDKNELVKEYINTKGDTEVFNEIFNYYVNETVNG